MVVTRPEEWSMQAPDVVVVCAATRDLSDTDPRGWLLGGGVTFGALALARLGLRTGVVLGLDREASAASELDLIRDAGVEVIEVPLERGPVFTNVETPAGRVQTCGSTSDPVPVDALPDAWRGAATWLFAPIASELPDAWTEMPTPDACVAFGWQGILRRLESGALVKPAKPTPSPFLGRADIVAVSRHDVPAQLDLREVGSWLAPRSDLLLTAGLLGGLLMHFEDGRMTHARVYPSVPSLAEVDPAGAGDTMLAGVVAARLVAGGRGRDHGRDLRLGASASSLLVEGPGLNSVPTFAQLMRRMVRST
jgi:sugar/nucleoside kinase (ribokinase family)